MLLPSSVSLNLEVELLPLSIDQKFDGRNNLAVQKNQHRREKSQKMWNDKDSNLEL
jgi:hypothetical protein